MNTQEIKAGQRWKSIAENYIATVEWADCNNILIRWRDGTRLELRSMGYFLRNFKPHNEPKARPITKDDIMKMLGVNPVLFLRGVAGHRPGSWSLLEQPGALAEAENLFHHEYSHNPFAPNPVIVGPEIEVVV